MTPRLFLSLAAGSLAAAACSGPSPVPDTFTRSGELIALSGGARGAAGACTTCHGLKGEGDGNLVPRLAGLDQGYLARQLGFYGGGERAHPQMAAIAGDLTRDQHSLVSAYYAALPEPPSATICAAPDPQIAVLYQRGDTRRGIASCASCHGADGRGAGLGYPPLAGQPAAYLADQLDRWRSGRRYGDAHGVMTRISQRLKPAEVRAVAAYSAGLADGPERRGSRATCPPARRVDPRSGA